MTKKYSVRKRLIEFIERIRTTEKDDLIFVSLKERYGPKVKVQFAPDFTEIHSYVNFLQVRDVTYDNKLSQAQQIALNEAILDYLFFSEKESVLLSGHHFELTNFARYSHLQPLADAVEVAAAIRDKGQSNWSEYDDFLSALAGRGAEQLSPQELVEQLEKVYRIAPELRLFLSADLKPAQRLQRLLRYGKIARVNRFLSERGIAHEKLNYEESPTYNWWFEKLTEMRPAGRKKTANAVDAMSIYELQQINSLLGDSEKVVLLSRSTIMRDLMSEGKNDSACDNVYISHPRAIGTFILADYSGSNALSLIGERHNLSLQALHAYEKGGHSKSIGGEYSNELRKNLDEIYDLWQEIDEVVIAQSIWRDPSKHSLFGAAKDTLTQLDKIANTGGSIREMLIERAAQIPLEIEREKAEISAITAVSNLDDSPIALNFHRKAPVTSGEVVPVFSLRAEETSMPYSLQLYDGSLDIGSRPSADALNFLKQILKSHEVLSEYERILSMGYIFASEGEWGLAYSFFNLALQSGSPVIPMHEAYYFRAIARRFASTSIEQGSVEEAFFDVKRARTEKQGGRHQGYEDPRFLCELGIISAHAERNGVALELDGAPAVPIELWERALHFAREDQILRLQVSNNTLYYTLSSEQNTDHTRIESLLARLEAELGSTSDQRRFPGALHTRAMARLTLGMGSEKVRQAVINELASIIADDFIFGSQRRVVEEDLERLRGGFSGV